ncbi:S-layer region-like protein [Trichormus variabilis ATCC 29413]|uniref:S-layer region-like protein n=2 Tax=Anabaena variabilis TaxID=264691 RepID=Q3M894_TRIV2|nr:MULTISPECIES: S-layer homology domain-containing protein [Nostocaceae]ABA22792.1 S-layer region-like protein [Trichormus variabilis ATCC 29413]MBC1216588.1 S-layer homology domain-containing protein [Trichormus variabilis ARAD]MBC1256082.1 S-layer homology domain-containing protein [Trichormus variabilis V5]MBC1268395.1 S-layer homology domain-containing protein [Trichormus variabilis FSR]MBC1304695.1 S-layer homology domain-containing protein [Trichormus variabilis N2B]
MLPCKRPTLVLSLAVFLTSLTACANTPTAKNLEQSLAADPRLQTNQVIFGETKEGAAQPKENQPSVQLPADFPQEIPLYQNAQLQEIIPASGSDKRVSTTWLSSDPSNFISSFYRNQFQTNNWQILQQPTDDVEGTFAARRNDLLVNVSIQPKSVTNATANQPQTATAIKIEYVPNSTTTAASNIPTAGDTQFIGPVPPTNWAKDNSTTPTVASEFNDVNKAPQQLRQYIQDLAALGVFSSASSKNKNNNPANQFEPGRIITRREYARWLVNANNAMYANNSAKQIRLAGESTQAAFTDVSSQDADFPAIQGLAEAGLIPSPLSGDATAVLFRPDAPLTREQLILWKVPLDTRQALPNANLEAVKETWGFQDAGKIDPKALRAVLADFQNGEQANIRRIFGYTTLFQPKKPVTRAEAAGALWYFGSQGEGISAVDALKLKQTTTQ